MNGWMKTENLDKRKRIPGIINCFRNFEHQHPILCRCQRKALSQNVVEKTKNPKTATQEDKNSNSNTEETGVSQTYHSHFHTDHSTVIKKIINTPKDIFLHCSNIHRRPTVSHTT
jgi:hypothetical protein